MDRPTNLMVINSVELFDEPPDWDRVKQIIQSRLVDRYPRSSSSSKPWLSRHSAPEGRPPLSVIDASRRLPFAATPPPGEPGGGAVRDCGRRRIDCQEEAGTA